MNLTYWRCHILKIGCKAERLAKCLFKLLASKADTRHREHCSDAGKWEATVAETHSSGWLRRAQGSDAQTYLILALSKVDDGTMEPVQMQKSMFLLAEEAGARIPHAFYQFEPYNWGPFCQRIYDDIKTLEMRGDVVVDRTQRVEKYILTPGGARKARDFQAKVPKEVDAYLSDVATWVKSQTFSSLLSAIYKKYPSYATKSIFNKQS